MAKSIHEDALKEKFRPATDDLDAQVEAALAGLDEATLYSFNKPQAETGANVPAQPGQKQTRRGTIVTIGKDDVFVDFGGKSQGIISRLQFNEEPVVGQEMEFIVSRYDAGEGLLVLTLRGALATNVNWDTVEVGQVVEAMVTGVNKGGLEVDVKGLRGFMPAGQVDLYHVPDLEQFKNQKIQVEITQADRAAKNLVVSRRNILEREKAAAKEKLMAELQEGQIRRGTVRSVMDFGAFVDLGGVDGLLHSSEMTFKRGRVNAAEFVKVGDVLDVKVTRIDKETGKLSLSLKQARGTDPWADASTRYAPGTTVTGRVTKVESFGAFVEVEEGFEGLLPISEMSYQRVKNASDVAKEGDTLKLVVLSIDPTARKCSFSLKQAGPDPWKSVEERYATDMVVKGKITRTADFGAFVELEPGLEGLVHISEISNQRFRSVNDVVKEGQDVDVRVMDIDKEHRRISLSIKSSVAPKLELGATSDTPKIPATQSKKNRPALRGGLDWNW